MSTESLSSNPEEINITEDILQIGENEEIGDNQVYLNRLQELDYNPETKDWPLLVELNARLSKHSKVSWFYGLVLKAKKDILYKSGEYFKSGSKKPRSIKEILEIYDSYNSVQPSRPRTRNPFANKELLVTFTAFSKVKNETQNITEIVPDFDEIRDFLEKHKIEINRLIAAIPKGQRSLLSHTKLVAGPTNGRFGLTLKDAKEESNKFANPMFTIWALSTNMAIGASNVPGTSSGPYGWYKGKIKGSAKYYPRWPRGMAIPDNPQILRSIRKASVSFMKILTEYIEPDVLNSGACLNPIVDMIILGNKHYPNVRPPQYVYNNPRDNVLSVQMLYLLFHAGLEDQSLTDISFDILGNNSGPIISNDLIDDNYIDPYDPYRGQPRNTLYKFMHLNIRKKWEEIAKLFDRKKLLSLAIGLDDPNSPLSELDADVFSRVGREVPVGYLNYRPSTIARRRNTFTRWNPNIRDTFMSQQRLKTLRGLESMHSDYNFDLREISEAIMKGQSGINPLDKPYSHAESRMIEDYNTYKEPEPEPEPEPEQGLNPYAESFTPSSLMSEELDVGDKVKWELDGKIIYGTITKRTKKQYKVLSTDDDEYYKDKKDLTKLTGGKRKRTLRKRRR